jgi:ubiquinone/menaquinone biosynthesis C-methylase UbiE
MRATADRRESWSRYWAGGALHSCATSFDGNYDDAIGNFWREVCSGMRADQRVLDVATGNGALPRLMLDLLGASGRLPLIDAIDLADIDPVWLRALSPKVGDRLRFHSRVLVEALPFADATFDLVVSQFGLEYSDLARSVDELRRVMKPGASAALVLHHAESLPVRLGRAEVIEIDWMNQAGGLLQRARRLLPFLARLATPAGVASVQRDPQAGKARAQFNEAMRELQHRASAAAAPDILIETQTAVGELMAHVMALGAVAAEQRLNAIRDGLRLARLRQAELVAHALDAAAVEQLAARISAGADSRSKIAPLHVRGELFGWSLRNS